MQPNPPTGRASEVHPVRQVVVEPTNDLVVKEPAAPELAVAPVLEEVATLAEKNLPLNPKKNQRSFWKKRYDYIADNFFFE
ncbi:hypothetical protein ACFX2F_027943 [Malus domestica]